MQIGLNIFALNGKLGPDSLENVMYELKKRKITYIEVCTIAPIPENSNQLFAEAEAEATARFGMPPGLVKGRDIFKKIEDVRKTGMNVCSCHILMANVYPEYVQDAVPYMKEIHEKAGISQFVISCMFDSVEKAESFAPYIQAAAKELKSDNIDLCYHNHEMDCQPLENGSNAMQMLLSLCPDLKFQPDTGWAWFGGMDAASFIRENKDRIMSVHLKDMIIDPDNRIHFKAVGTGSANSAACIEAAKQLDLAPGKLMIDNDDSDRDLYDDIEDSVEFILDSFAIKQ